MLVITPRSIRELWKKLLLIACEQHIYRRDVCAKIFNVSGCYIERERIKTKKPFTIVLRKLQVSSFAITLKVMIVYKTHPIAVENGDLFSSADNFVVALVVLQDCVAVPPTTTF